MKQLYLKSILLMIFVIAQMQAMALVVILPRPEGLTQIEGLYYYLDDNTMTAEVTYAGVHVEKYKPIGSPVGGLYGERIVQNQYISGDVAIPSTVTNEGKSYTVTKIGSSAFSEQSVTSIIVPSTVTSIGAYAFSSTSSLQSINFFSTNPPVLEDNAFAKIGASVIIIVDKKSVNIYKSTEGWKDLYITDVMEYVLDGIIYGIDEEESTAYVKSAFADIQVADIPKTIDYNGTMLTVTRIGNDAFMNCRDLTSVTIPNSVTEIGMWAFKGCSSLTSLTIPNSVTSLQGGAFWDCTSLTSVTIPNSVTDIWGCVFENCSSLTSINIPDGVTEIGDNTFSGCISLTSVHITDLAAWCNISFNYDGNPLAYAHHLYLNGEEVKDLVIPNGVTNVGHSAFEGCSGLTSVTIPDGVTSIDYFAFKGCSGLTSVTIPNSVTYISHNAFEGCSGLTSVTIPNSVTYISSNAFEGCTSLTSLTLGNGVTETSASVFKACGNLTSVTLNNNAIASATYTSSKSLKDIFGSQVTTYVLGDSVTSIGRYAFYGCSDLSSVTIPESVSAIGYSAFSGCSGLTSVHITDLAAWCKIDFDSNPLSYAHHLYLNGEEVKDLVIPNGVTSIGGYAFSGCSGLTSVTIPNSVTSIGAYAFLAVFREPIATMNSTKQ